MTPLATPRKMPNWPSSALWAVRAVLVTQGVAEDKVELKKPEQALASGPAAEARRVEVTLK
jgi:K(+)-stimulated pyrophosphate-energized sodium pump